MELGVGRGRDDTEDSGQEIGPLVGEVVDGDFADGITEALSQLRIARAL